MQKEYTYRKLPNLKEAREVLLKKLERYIAGTLDLEVGERRDNIKETITEALAQYSMYKAEGIFPIKPITGDLMTPSGKRIEVKGVSSTGPMSFGPTEKWDILLVVDVTQMVRGYENFDIMNNLLEKTFTVYKFDVDNNDIGDLILTKKTGTTFKDQCIAGRRPRFSLSLLRDNKIGQILFHGTLDSLFKNRLDSHPDFQE